MTTTTPASAMKAYDQREAMSELTRRVPRYDSAEQAVEAAIAPQPPVSREDADEIDAMLWNLLLHCKHVVGESTLTMADTARFRLLRANLGLAMP